MRCDEQPGSRQNPGLLANRDRDRTLDGRTSKKNTAKVATRIVAVGVLADVGLAVDTISLTLLT